VLLGISLSNLSLRVHPVGVSVVRAFVRRVGCRKAKGNKRKLPK